MPIHPCSADDGNAAGYLITNLDDDVTMALCTEHFAGYAVSFVQAYAEANAPSETDTAESVSDPEAGADDLDDLADDMAQHPPAVSDADATPALAAEPPSQPKRRRSRPTGETS